MAIIRDGRFGQAVEASEAAAITPPISPSLLAYFAVAVAAGVTVFLITRAIGKR